MDEARMKKRTKRILLLSILLGMLLCVSGVGIWLRMMKMAHEADHKQMQAEAMEYKVFLKKQIDKNLQILTTLAKVLEVSSILEDTELLETSLTETNTANHFMNMMYFDQEGKGIINLAKAGDRYHVLL